MRQAFELAWANACLYRYVKIRSFPLWSVYYNLCKKSKDYQLYNIIMFNKLLIFNIQNLFFFL